MELIIKTHRKGATSCITERSLAFLGRCLRWDRSAAANCLILDTTILPKWGWCLENLTWVYDHVRGKSVSGYELLFLAIVTPGKITSLERLRQHLSALLTRIFVPWPTFMIHPPCFGLISPLSSMLSMS